MFKTRVKFRAKGSDILQMGYLVKSKEYGGFKVKSADGKSGYAIELLDILDRI